MENVLELKNVTKIYEGGVLANHDVNFAVCEGEIHALVGENGAGKSTLMKVLFGTESLTSGQILLRGQPVKFASSKDAIANGIGMVHQHFMLVESFTGAENLMLGLKGTGPVIHAKREAAEALKAAEKYGFTVDATRKVRDMSVGMKQKLEIMKILYQGAKIIILDEPTAVLTPQETEELFSRLLELKNHGMTIIFISHKLDEVKQISDRVTVLKSGRTMGTYNTAEVSTEDISALMVGRVVTLEYDKPAQTPTKTLLETNNLRYKDQFGVMKLDGVSITLRDSEIVGIAGVEGNGQSELVGIITANMRCLSGTVAYKGQDITADSIRAVRDMGIAYVPEDRMHNGCAGPMNIQENLVASNIDSFCGKTRMLDSRKVRSHSQTLIKEFGVKTQSENSAIKSLSGGNIQKVIVAREFTAGGDVLVLDQPTRGVDVGAISFIHQKILEMRAAGKGILLVSADLNELIALADRILVMYKGKVVAELENEPKVNDTELGLYMLGLKTQADAGKEAGDEGKNAGQKAI